ncbi:aspartate/glutamate racemase family protein [Sphingopyxis sp. BSN-002]|uniref:aspartate/glutamate racemase family protein n=1 Tax=Sphingopyxis sp. BSN-002 TaxID=2911495 RepID=UPI001ED9D5A5|nr:aspartate/glutamate racemase family protein [Sphingopyxis sp. BSN-002]UKK84342.1 aspartate/glutamate racemase family protein [Sphingopyxis sp. BSN-002]
MKTIGLIGGLSWESSAEYYRLLNRAVRDRLGGLHAANIVMHSLDFAPVAALQAAGDWPALDRAMVEAAGALERAGADMLLICSNTMHRCAGAIEAASTLPLIHIADPVTAAVKGSALRRVGLLGTAFTMEQDFYRGRMAEAGLEVIIPDDAGRAAVHGIIYDELVRGIIREESRAIYRQVIGALVARGAEAIVLGCTEIMLLIGEQDSAVPLFDTLALHVDAAVEAAF